MIGPITVTASARESYNHKSRQEDITSRKLLNDVVQRISSWLREKDLVQVTTDEK